MEIIQAKDTLFMRSCWPSFLWTTNRVQVDLRPGKCLFLGFCVKAGTELRITVSLGAFWFPTQRERINVPFQHTHKRDTWGLAQLLEEPLLKIIVTLKSKFSPIQIKKFRENCKMVTPLWLPKWWKADEMRMWGLSVGSASLGMPLYKAS